jgi:hypothetical protein
VATCRFPGADGATGHIWIVPLLELIETDEALGKDALGTPDRPSVDPMSSMQRLARLVSVLVDGDNSVALAPGTRLGADEILSLIGSGGIPRAVSVAVRYSHEPIVQISARQMTAPCGRSQTEIADSADRVWC